MKRITKYRYYRHHACLFAIVRKDESLSDVIIPRSTVWLFLKEEWRIRRWFMLYRGLKVFIFYRHYQLGIYRDYYEESMELVKEIEEQGTT